MYNIKLNKETYRDKVYACWIGKNIGGTMGTPFEGLRQINNITGFTTPPSVVLPNDDLDLQLVWLYALEQNGPNAINTAMLGEHWVSYITPHWNEYGIGKANMKRGLPPPMSGDYDNDWCNSNGAWIRSEIWATVAPAMPHVAAKYAMEDAMVDHGAGEGTFAAAFVAALQSAAFVISDLRKCDGGEGKMSGSHQQCQTCALKQGGDHGCGGGFPHPAQRAQRGPANEHRREREQQHRNQQL